MERVNKILLICLTSIDDAVLITSLIKPLQLKHPHSKIEVLVKSEFTSLFNDNPLIENVLTYNKYILNKSMAMPKTARIKGFVSLIKTLKHRDYELVVDIRRTWLSGLMAKSCFPDHYYALTSSGIRYHYKATKQLIVRNGDSTKTSMLCLLNNMVSEKEERLALAIPESKNNMDRVNELLRRNHLGRYVVLCPFNNTDYNLNLSYWRRLIQEINTHTDLPVVIVGSSKHSVIAEMMAEDLSNVVNLVAETTLEQNIIILKKALAIAGCDRILLPVADNLGLNILTPDLLSSMDISKQLRGVQSNFPFLTRTISEKLSFTPDKSSLSDITTKYSIENVVSQLTFTGSNR